MVLALKKVLYSHEARKHNKKLIIAYSQDFCTKVKVRTNHPGAQVLEAKNKINKNRRLLDYKNNESQ